MRQPLSASQPTAHSIKWPLAQPTSRNVPLRLTAAKMNPWVPFSDVDFVALADTGLESRGSATQ